MREEIRRAIAHATLSAAGGRHVSMLFSPQAARPMQMTACSRTIYDHEARAHIVPQGNGRLYHNGLNTHLWFRMEGLSFTGYDHDSKQKFTGRVEGNWVQLFDLREKRFYSYYAAPSAPPARAPAVAATAIAAAPAEQPARKRKRIKKAEADTKTAPGRKSRPAPAKKASTKGAQKPGQEKGRRKGSPRGSP
jgi:hypothetical protein